MLGHTLLPLTTIMPECHSTCDNIIHHTYRYCCSTNIVFPDPMYKRLRHAQDPNFFERVSGLLEADWRRLSIGTPVVNSDSRPSYPRGC